MSRIPRSPDFDQRLADWLEDDPDHAPAEVLSTVVAAFPLIPQRRARRVPWRFQPMSLPVRLAAATIALMAVVVGGAMILRPPDLPGVGALPSQTPSPAPTLIGSVSYPSIPPVPTPSPRIPGTMALLQNMAMEPNVTYSTLQFRPALTLKGGAGFQLGQEHPDSLWFPSGDGASPYDASPQVQFIVPSGVMEGGSPYSSPQPMPTDLIASLRTRPDMTVGPSHPITVGGVQGTYADGELKSNAPVDRTGYENVICAASVPDCQVDAFAIGMGIGRPFRVIVLDVHGQTVVIGLNTAGPAADFSGFDDFLNGVAWQATP